MYDTISEISKKDAFRSCFYVFTDVVFDRHENVVQAVVHAPRCIIGGARAWLGVEPGKEVLCERKAPG